MSEQGLLRIVQGVGDSRKRGKSWQNGQFGFGMHAFRAAAQRLAIYTKVANTCFVTFVVAPFCMLSAPPPKGSVLFGSGSG